MVWVFVVVRSVLVGVRWVRAGLSVRGLLFLLSMVRVGLFDLLFCCLLGAGSGDIFLFFSSGSSLSFFSRELVICSVMAFAMSVMALVFLLRCISSCIRSSFLMALNSVVRYLANDVCLRVCVDDSSR